VPSARVSTSSLSFAGSAAGGTSVAKLISSSMPLMPAFPTVSLSVDGGVERPKPRLCHVPGRFGQVQLLLTWIRRAISPNEHGGLVENIQEIIRIFGGNRPVV
jgi:hypothetical protein